MIDRLELIGCDNFHTHLRGPDVAGRPGLMGLALPRTVRSFGRAIVMPNVPWIDTAEKIVDHRQAILAALDGADFEPLMTLALTDETTPAMLAAAKEAGAVAVKLYPRGVTTGSDHGVTEPRRLVDCFRAMADLGLVCLLHPEQPGVFVLDRQRQYMPTVRWLLDTAPTLKVVMEHISTAEAADMVDYGPETLAATVTPMHLYGDLDLVLGDGLKPHNFCYPVLNSPEDCEALLALVESGHPRVFAGTDSAPHPVAAKEAARGCAGVYCEPVALALYAEVFEHHVPDWDHQLQAFLGHRGADFYGLPRDTRKRVLVRRPWPVPEAYIYEPLPNQHVTVVPFLAGETVGWTVE